MSCNYIINRFTSFIHRGFWYIFGLINNFSDVQSLLWFIKTFKIISYVISKYNKYFFWEEKIYYLWHLYVFWQWNMFKYNSYDLNVDTFRKHTTIWFNRAILIFIAFDMNYVLLMFALWITIDNFFPIIFPNHKLLLFVRN